MSLYLLLLRLIKILRLLMLPFLRLSILLLLSYLLPLLLYLRSRYNCLSEYNSGYNNLSLL